MENIALKIMLGINSLKELKLATAVALVGNQKAPDKGYLVPLEFNERFVNEHTPIEDLLKYSRDIAAIIYKSQGMFLMMDNKGDEIKCQLVEGFNLEENAASIAEIRKEGYFDVQQEKWKTP